MTPAQARALLDLPEHERRVVYLPSGPHGEQYHGVVTRVCGRFVFVRYGGHQAVAATRPGDLTIVATDP